MAMNCGNTMARMSQAWWPIFTPAVVMVSSLPLPSSTTHCTLPPMATTERALSCGNTMERMQAGWQTSILAILLHQVILPPSMASCISWPTTVAMAVNFGNTMARMRQAWWPTYGQASITPLHRTWPFSTTHCISWPGTAAMAVNFGNTMARMHLAGWLTSIATRLVPTRPI